MSLSWIVTAETSFDLAACIEELNESLSEERDDPGEAKWIRDTVEESLNNLHMCSECQSKTVEGQLCVVLRNAKDEGVIKIIGCATAAAKTGSRVSWRRSKSCVNAAKPSSGGSLRVTTKATSARYPLTSSSNECGNGDGNVSRATDVKTIM